MKKFKIAPPNACRNVIELSSQDFFLLSQGLSRVASVESTFLMTFIYTSSERQYDGLRSIFKYKFLLPPHPTICKFFRKKCTNIWFEYLQKLYASPFIQRLYISFNCKADSTFSRILKWCHLVWAIKKLSLIFRP